MNQKDYGKNLINKERKVLVIEDDEISRLILTNKLAEEFEVLSAEDGKVGLEMLRDHPEVDLVVLDILMPVMDGYAFLKIVKMNPELKDIPVVVITGNFSEDDEVKCLEMGAVDFLSKPYNPQEALVRIRNVIRMNESSAALLEMEKDELTGLYTKQAFLRYAEERLEKYPDREFAILGFNIENFKAANSQYGEKKCDEFLRYIGIKIKKILTRAIAGRFGGDQFVIMFDNDADKTTVDRVDEIAKVIFKHAPIPHQVAKIGIYAPIDRNVPLTRCCDRAFLAIREVKGVYEKHVAFYDDSMREQLMNEQRILDGMEAALSEEQFIVYYQPKHGSISGRIAGAEALIRWKHPEFGFMPPSKFIPLFEKNGFITRVDSFVIERVCRDITQWMAKGLPLVPISVNVSRRDYMEEGWIDRQIQVIDEYEIPHNLIHFEVTESLFAENIEVIIKQIRKVQKLGFLVEMDDFGAGYSSLGMLASFPFDIIKLDISFVRQLDTNKVVIENIIKVAHKMGLKTVAEGAETEKQFNVLRYLGCDFIQGYYFSRPLQAPEYEEYLCQKVDEAKLHSESIGEIVEPIINPKATVEEEKSAQVNSLLAIIRSLEEASYKDSLTGFNNRRAYFDAIERIERGLYETESLGIVFADVNGLKSMNDNFGHLAGDAMIVHVGEKIQAVFPNADIYRMGGDEFVVLDFSVEESAFEKKVGLLKSSWTESESAAIGAVWMPIAHHMEKYMAMADRKMYQDKNQYYDKQFNKNQVDIAIDPDHVMTVMKQVAKALPCGFFAYHADQDESLIVYNDEIVKIYGCDDMDDFARFTKSSFKGMVHPDDKEKIDGSISNQISQHNDIDYVEYRIVCKDGTIKNVRDYGRFIHTDLYGNVFFVLMMELM